MVVKVRKKMLKEKTAKEFVFISYDDIFINKYISQRDIKNINKLIGIDDFVYYPKKINSECGGGDPIETIIIPIATSVFSNGLYDTLKIAIIELVKKIRKRTQKKKQEENIYEIDFHICDESSGFKLDLYSNVNADPEHIESILEKAKEIVEIVKK